jgi:threonylcarbamoyladenosine tRNA methylthiotransferase MtaB
MEEIKNKCRKVAFFTLGCKVNQYETNAMTQQFIDHGYEVVDFEETSDIYVINTCSVTNMSEKKSRQMIRKAKTTNPNSIMAVVGCYAQVAKEELEKLNEIDIILGINEKKEIVEYIERYLKEKSAETEISDVMKQTEFVDFGSITYTEKTRAVIKVQDGCDRFCSYCIIPYARGRVRSRKIDSVVEEIKEIVKKGIKEVVITGIHIASYGKDFKENIGIIDLLEEINQIPDLKRIRLGSLEPTLITEEFVNRLKKLDKICDHFHLSLQSGCNETLKRMNRRYTTEQFEKGTQILRKVYPNVCLTTDIIVGFPGETQEEFNQTYEFLKNIKFYKMHVFKYSPRKGTKAASMKDQIDGNTKEKRSQMLIELSDSNQKEYLDSYIGKKVEVLFESEKGHTTNYIEVRVLEGKENLGNKIQEIKIIKREELELIGE